MDPTDTARTEAERRRERPGDASGPLTSRRTLLKGTGAGIAASGLGAAASGTASASEHGIDTPWLHVEGNKVLDPLGNEVILRGVNIPDPKRLDHTVPMRGKNWDHMIDLATDHERGWYANVIRIPVHPGDVAELPPVPEAEAEFHEPVSFEQSELVDYCETYLDDVVEFCRQQNVYCIVDYHRHWGEGALDWRNRDLDEEVRLFWDTVARRYADDPHVIFEVYNEPTLPAMYLATGEPYEWYDQDAAGVWRMWKQSCQSWIDVIREHAPENLIIVGSPGWSAMPEGAQIEQFDGGNLMYAYHIYGGHGLESESDFDGRGTEEGTAEVWRDVPLFMTEFGWEPNIGQWISGTTDGFGSAVTEWADDRPIHWTAWCFDITWLPSMWERSFVDGDPDDSVGDPYSSDIPEHCPDPPCEWDLLGRDVGDYSDYAGEYIRETLEARRNDDVPGIDHPDEAPDAPASVSADAAGPTTADVTWSAVSDAGDVIVDHYEVYVDGEKRLETTSTSATVDRLYAGSTYQIGVAAVDVHGQTSEPATTAVTTASSSAGAPAAPGSPAVVDRDFDSVTLEWSGGGTDVVEYVVYLDGDEVARTAPEETSVVLDDLDVGGRYDVAVTAVGPNGDESGALEAVVEPIPPGGDADGALTINDYEGAEPFTNNSMGGWVGGGMAQGVEDGAAVMEWEDHIYHATTIELPDGDDGDYEYVCFLARGDDHVIENEQKGHTQDVLSPAGGELSVLEVDFGDLSGTPLGDLTDDRVDDDWSVVRLPLSAAGAVEGQLQVEGTHDTFGRFYLDEIWLASEDDPSDGLVSSGSVDRPDAPSNVTATADSETQVTVSWDPVPEADHYVVTGDHQAETTDTSVTVDGLAADTTYEFGVAAVDADGTESLTRTATVTTPGDGGQCSDAAATAEVEDQTVCDLNDDGKFRDVTGDGEVAQDDVVHFFENQHRDAWKQPELFDFSDSDSVGHGDVVALFEDVSL